MAAAPTGPKSTEELISEWKEEIEMTNAKEMLTKMTEKCFHKCVYKPGKSLDATEQRCISLCMDHFLDSWDLISRTFNNRMERESLGGRPNLT